MSQSSTIRLRPSRLSLSVRVSVLLVLATLLPLVVTVTTIELISRPALVAQASRDMETDARTRTNLIDNYFTEQILEAQTLSRLPAVQKFVAGDTAQQAKALDGFATGHIRGSFYENWSLYDLDGNLKLFYPTEPQQHGKYYVLPDDRQKLISSKSTVISDTFFNSVSNEAYIDIYTPVVNTTYQIVGMLRSSFDLHYIWQTIDSEANANGTGSYAFILDHNGMRIAYTNSQPDIAGFTRAPQLLKAVAPFSAKTKQLIRDADLYGLQGKQEPLLADQTLAGLQKGNTLLQTFQMTPAEQQETFQVTRSMTYTVPWTYFVLSPLRVVTQSADQQLFIALSIATVVLVLAALIGLRIGRGITRPILRSVDFLTRNSQSLKLLSSRQQSAVEEQMWVVEASQTGLEKVQYYSQAINVAARQLNEVGNDLIQNWQHLNERDIRQALQKMIAAAQYIEKARAYQSESDNSLASAIRVTTHVTDQLSKGATSAAEAATDLEDVLNQLRSVV